MSKGKYENWKNYENAEYRMDEQFQNYQFLEPNFGFPD